MEILIEELIGALLEGSVYASKSNKVPKTVRYILIIFIILFYLSLISLTILLGIYSLIYSVFWGSIVVLLGIFFLIMSIIKFIKTYLKIK